jgi:uncharacterized membrane protein YeaQ/YmgE (transglycosylase-associated protein family)
MVWTILVTLVAGTIIGLLGKAVAPKDRDSIPLWLTVLCGIGGCLLGSFLYAKAFDCTDMQNCTNGVDWWRHAWQVGVAAILVVLAASLYGQKRS